MTQAFTVRETAPSRPVRAEEARVASNVVRNYRLSECYLSSLHLYDSTVSTSKNSWFRDAL